MYLTPGFHVGQFADFPAGFTHSGQDIPPSFTGPLTPQTRTTARFAIGITFKGFNIPTGSSKSSGQVAGQSSTKQAAKGELKVSLNFWEVKIYTLVGAAAISLH